MANFSKRLLKKLPNGYEEKAQSMDLSSIKEEMYKLQRNIASSQKDMDNDADVERLKEELKDAKEPYTETINGAKLMIRFLCHVLSERGID